MPPGPPVSAMVVVATSIAVAIPLVGDTEPFSPGAGAATAVVLIAMSVIAASGMMLARGRWARWLIVGLAASQLASAIMLEIGWQWIAVIAVAVVVEVVAAGPGSQRWLRTLPSATGPPPLAVAMLLGLVAFPALVAVSNLDGIPLPAVAGAALAWTAAAAYSRSGVAGLLALRALVPLGAGLATVATPLPALIAVAVAGAGLGAMTWSPTIRRAASPLVPLRSPGYRIPPELAPPEVLDAAGLDEHGRRR